MPTTRATSSGSGRARAWAGCRALGVCVGLLVAPVASAAPAAAPAPAEGDDEEGSPKISTRVTAEGVVIATLRVAARPAAVREVLAGAERAHRLAATTISAKATKDGDCEKVALSTRGLFAPFELDTRRCPTKTGWREVLVRSTDFKEYWNEWSVQGDGDGALVTFKTRTMPDVAVPESIILAQTRRVLVKLMKSLLAALGER